MRKPLPLDALPRLEVHLGDAMRELGQWLRYQQPETPVPELERARFADGCRDAGVIPLPLETFDVLTDGLNDQEWQRLSLLIRGTSEYYSPTIYEVLSPLAAARSVESLFAEGFVEVAQNTPLLTMEFLQGSNPRGEELTRHFLYGLGVHIKGETPEESVEELDRLDFSRLTAEANRAKASAEERVEYLRELMREEARNRSPRGKW